jgi:uncharacterized Ntn-hydrolase superfamily protein
MASHSLISEETSNQEKRMIQRVGKAGNIKYALSGDDDFIASVEPGETFVVECAINVNDGTIRHLVMRFQSSNHIAALETT